MKNERRAKIIELIGQYRLKRRKSLQRDWKNRVFP